MQLLKFDKHGKQVEGLHGKQADLNKGWMGVHDIYTYIYDAKRSMVIRILKPKILTLGNIYSPLVQ
jgi:hypothetical protein